MKRFLVPKGTHYTITKGGKLYEATLNLSRTSGRKYSFLRTSKENIFNEEDSLTGIAITKASSCYDWSEVNERYFLSNDSYDGSYVQNDTLVKPYGVSLEILERLMREDVVYLSREGEEYGMIVHRTELREV